MQNKRDLKNIFNSFLYQKKAQRKELDLKTKRRNLPFKQKNKYQLNILI